MNGSPLLSVRRLTTVFDLPDGPVAAVNDASFDIHAGETLCLVGESGCGKSLTAFSILRLLPPTARIAGGQLIFKGADLMALHEDELQVIRGAEIGLIFQEPMRALNPVFTIGEQIVETLVTHGRARTKREARAQAIDWLRRVRVPDPGRRVDDYAHQLSGGLRQRALIALALAGNPSLLVADEPTTALDATIQSQILDLLRDLRDELGLGLLLITHDLGVVAETGDRVAVMYAGRIVEEAPVELLFHDPKHPYTGALLAASPGGTPGRPLGAIPGVVPAPGSLPIGCAFAPRCPVRFEPCSRGMPAVSEPGAGRMVRCFQYGSQTEPAFGEPGWTPEEPPG